MDLKTSPTLPTERAFVVQLSGDLAGGREVSGRVEHVSTGEAIHFATALELVSFMRRIAEI